MHNKFKLSLILLLSLTISACSISREGNPRLERYTLSSEVLPIAYALNYDVNVELAPILNNGGVVIAVSDVELRPAKNYRYSSNLDNELKLLFVDALYKQNNEQLKQYSYEIKVSKFQGDLKGNVFVSAYIKVVDNKDNKVIYSHNFQEQSVLKDDGYTALVAELKQSYLNIINECFKSIN